MLQNKNVFQSTRKHLLAPGCCLVESSAEALKGSGGMAARWVQGANAWSDPAKGVNWHAHCRLSRGEPELIRAAHQRSPGVKLPMHITGDQRGMLTAAPLLVIS